MRVIDYALARGAHVRVSVGRFYGSDHRLVIYTVTRQGKTLRVGLWNARRDRSPGLVASFAWSILQRVDVLAIVEADDYLPALRRMAADSGARLLAADVLPGQAGQAFLVRDHLSARFALHRATRRGWITVRGGRTPAKYLPTVTVDDWLTIGAGHRPPSCRWRRGLVVGPVRRVASTIAHARAEVRWARRVDGPALLLADWNATPTARGRWSPRWVARRAGLHIVAPAQGTHR